MPQITLPGTQWTGLAHWKVPPDCTSLTVELWGGGGSGAGGRCTDLQSVCQDPPDCNDYEDVCFASNSGGGGGGGGYMLKVLSVTPGDIYDFYLGGPGEDSWFSNSSTYVAHAGTAGSDDGTDGGDVTVDFATLAAGGNLQLAV